jgi:hypothetical protein
LGEVFDYGTNRMGCQAAAFSVQRSAFSVQRSAFSVQRSDVTTLNAQRGNGLPNLRFGAFSG